MTLGWGWSAGVREEREKVGMGKGRRVTPVEATLLGPSPLTPPCTWGLRMGQEAGRAARGKVGGRLGERQEPKAEVSGAAVGGRTGAALPVPWADGGPGTPRGSALP